MDYRSDNSYLARYYSKEDKFLLFAKINNEDKEDPKTIFRIGIAEQLNHTFGYGTEFKFSSDTHLIENSEVTFCLKHDFIHGNVKSSINNNYNVRVQSHIQLTKSSLLEGSVEVDLLKGEQYCSLSFQIQ